MTRNHARIIVNAKLISKLDRDKISETSVGINYV